MLHIGNFQLQKKLAPNIIGRKILNFLISGLNFRLINKWQIFGNIDIWIKLKNVKI